MNLLRTLSLGKGASRRQLLKALGLGAAAVPLMPRLDGWAAGSAPPTRLLLLFSSSGVVPENYNPTGTETAWNFPTGMLASTAPLTDHKADIIFLKGLARGAGGGGGHEQSMGGLWTGNVCQNSAALAPSVDQIIASKLPKMTKYQSYPFGVMCGYAKDGDITSKLKNNNPYMIHGPGGSKILSETDIYKNFDNLFAGLGSGGPADMMNMDKLRAERQSVLDALKEDFNDVTAKVGKEDRAKIAQHLDGIRDIERRLSSAGPTLMGAIPARPGAGIALDKSANYPMLIDITNKMVVATLSSDITRIATLQYSRGFSQIKHTWAGATTDHHTLSHMTSQKDVLSKIQGFYCTKLADLLKQMKAVQEGGQNLLDSNLCVYSNELALGWTHGVSPAATWWATGNKGRMNGIIKSTGRFLDFSDGSYDYNQMLQTVVRAMGVQGVDKVGNFGKPGVIPTLLA